VRQINRGWEYDREGAKEAETDAEKLHARVALAAINTLVLSDKN
jgi:hypothetical protein